MLKVDPCSTKKNKLCCSNSGADVCEDNKIIVSGRDLPVGWFMSGFVVQCSKDWSKLGECGTYIEIHKPNDPRVLDQVQLLEDYYDGF